MNQSKPIAAQLQRREPAAWTALLRRELESEELVVTAVSTELLSVATEGPVSAHSRRYLLALEGTSDPVSFIARETNAVEIQFYRLLAPALPDLTPRCLFTHLDEERGRGWLVLVDAPHDFPPTRWLEYQIENGLLNLARLHSRFRGQEKTLLAAGFPHFIGEKRHDWDSLINANEQLFTDGPAAMISEHALMQVKELAPRFVQAANGLAVMRALGGWPGVMGETHLTAVADLLDDPVPLLTPLSRLPQTLLHGAPHAFHWRHSLFDDSLLVGWQQATVGPGVLDLIGYLEQFDLLSSHSGETLIQVCDNWPLSEETLIDDYLLALWQEGEGQVNSREIRLAIPAARCLHTLLHWFPFFATWFEDMPDPYAWQKVNRMSNQQLLHTPFKSIARYRVYLQKVFERFLIATRSL